MSDLEKAARQALEALNKAFEMRVTNHPKWEELARTTIIALRQALEQPKQKQEPLTEEQIETISKEIERSDFFDCVVPFARAIEAAYGIGEKT